MVPLYIQYLGAKTYGDWIVILSLASYLELANLGMGQTITNRVAESVATGRTSEVGDLVSTAFFSYLALAATALAALALFTPYLAARLDLRAHAVALTALAVYLAMNLLSFPLRVNLLVLQGFERVDQEQAIVATTTAARVIALTVALLAGLRLVGVAFINGAAAMAMASAAYLFSRRLGAEIRPRLSRFSARLLRAMLAPSIAFFGVQAGTTLILGTDNLVIGYALGSVAVTTYAVPFRLIMLGRGLFTVAIGAMVPTIAASYARRHVAELRRAFILATRLGLAYGAGATVALWILGPGFIRLWAGPGVFPGRATFGLQLFVLFNAAWLATASTILWATTHHYAWSALTIFEGVLNLALSLWWVRVWGLPGVIGATIVASVLTNSWYLPYRAMRVLEIAPGAALRELGPALLLAGCSVAAVLVLWEPTAASWPETIRAALIAEPALLAAFALIAFGRGERQVALDWIAGWIGSLRTA
jgi:O-antigen/teichoic acid export membrane protein